AAVETGTAVPILPPTRLSGCRVLALGVPARIHSWPLSWGTVPPRIPAGPAMIWDGLALGGVVDAVWDEGVADPHPASTAVDRAAAATSRPLRGINCRSK